MYPAQLTNEMKVPLVALLGSASEFGEEGGGR